MKWWTCLLLVVFVFVFVFPASDAAAQSQKGASVVQKTVQKSPVQNVPKLQVEMPKATQKTPVQKEVILSVKAPCVKRRYIFCRRCHGNPHKVKVKVRAYGCLVCVGGCSCR